MLFRLLYNWYVVPRVRRCSTEESSVLVYVKAAHCCSLSTGASSRVCQSSRTPPGFQVWERASWICIVPLRLCSCLFLQSSTSAATCTVEQIYLNSVPVMPEFERFVSGRLSLPRVAFATFFFPDPRDSSSVIFLDSLLLMWQPMCHHAPAVRRGRFRSEHTASTAGAATFPLLYQMLLK